MPASNTPPAASAPAPAAPVPTPLAVTRYGVVCASWFPPDKSIRCGAIGPRVHVDIREVLHIATHSSASLRKLFGTWFSNENLESTLLRFGLDMNHWRNVQWGGQGDRRVAVSLFLMLPVLRIVGSDVAVRLADELEARLGMGLDIAVHGTRVPSGDQPQKIEAKLDEIISILIGEKRKEKADQQESTLKRARLEADISRANYERDHPDQAYASKFKAIREALLEASTEGNHELCRSLRVKLSELVHSL